MSTNKKGHGPRTRYYVIGTGAYLVVMALGAYRLGFFDPAGEPIGPSEWGDVLSGLFSPLAFLWLIYASLSQRAELELQREELRQNNETQQDQQRELSRQADTMIAQTKRLEAQASATYDPVFVLRRTKGNFSTDSFMMLAVKNEGGTALNVSFSSALESRSIHLSGDQFETKISSRVIPYWPAGSVAHFMLEMPQVEDQEPEFSMMFRRLDAKAVTHRYILADQARRMDLRGVDYDDDVGV